MAVYNSAMEHRSTPSIHSPDDHERERAMDCVLRRLDALQRYVRKCCFGETLSEERIAVFREQARHVDHALGRAASEYCGDLSTPPEEVMSACLENPAVRNALLDLEKMVVAERGHASPRADFASFGITRGAA